MKVLQVNCVWRKGSTGKLTADIHEELLRRGVESVVCYGRGEPTREPHVYKTCGELYSKLNNLATRFTGVMYGGCGLSTRRLMAIIEREQPDIVHLQCVNGYFVNIYKLITWLKERRVKTVVTLHAEFLYTGSCGYALDCEKWRAGCGRCPRLRQATGSLLRDGTAESQRRMKQAFADFDTAVVIGVSDWVTGRARRSPVMGGLRFERIYNGICTGNFHPLRSPEEDAALRKTYNIPQDKRVVLHVTPGFSHTKGGDLFLRLAARLPETHHAVVVGQGGRPGSPHHRHSLYPRPGGTGGAVPHGGCDGLHQPERQLSHGLPGGKLLRHPGGGIPGGRRGGGHRRRPGGNCGTLR